MKRATLVMKIDFIDLPSANVLLLQLLGWRDAWLWTVGCAGARVNNGNGVARTLSQRLMDLHLSLVLLLLMMVHLLSIVLEGSIVEVVRRCGQNK